MPRTTVLRRALGTVAVAAVAVTGLAIATPTAQAEPVTYSCNADMAPTSIAPGETSTMNLLTSDDEVWFRGAPVIDGLVQSPWTTNYHSGQWTYSYDEWKWMVPTAMPTETAGWAFYAPGTTDGEIADGATPLCSAIVTLEAPEPTAQSIDFPAIDNTPLATGTITLGATATSGLPITYATDDASVCTVAGSTLTLVGQGECHVTASQPGDEDYAAATNVDRWFSVQLPQTVTFPAIANQLLSTGSIQLGATASSDRWIMYTVADSSVCSVPVLTGATYGDRETAQTPISADTLTLHKVGTCTVTAQQLGGGEWLPSDEVTRSFKIYETSDAPVLTLQASTGVALSKRTVAFSASSTAATPAVKVTSATPAVCAVSGSAVALKKAGTCTIAASQAGAVTVKRSFPVWGAPAIPAKGKTTQTVTVLGQGEGDLSVSAGPAKVCRTSGNDVLLLGTGTCKVTVADGRRTVRKGSIKVAYVKSATPSSQLQHGGTAYFAFDSAKLTAKAKKALSGHLDTLRDATTVVVYGNTYGPGKNSGHSRTLAAQRAAAVVKYLKKHGVKAKAVTVAAAMENPVSKNPAKNRRADVYYTD